MKTKEQLHNRLEELRNQCSGLPEKDPFLKEAVKEDKEINEAVQLLNLDLPEDVLRSQREKTMDTIAIIEKQAKEAYKGVEAKNRFKNKCGIGRYKKRLELLDFVLSEY